MPPRGPPPLAAFLARARGLGDAGRAREPEDARRARGTARCGPTTRWRRTGPAGHPPPPTVRASLPAVRPSLRAHPARPQRRAVAGQVAAGPAGVRRDGEGRQILGRQAAAELGGEEQIGQLGRAVGDPGVAWGVAGDVVELETSEAMHVGADGDDPRPLGRDDAVEQQPGRARNGRGGWSPSAARTRRRSGGTACPSRRRCSRGCRAGRAWRGHGLRRGAPTPGRPGRGRATRATSGRARSRACRGPAGPFSSLRHAHDHVGAVLGQSARRSRTRCRCWLR